MPVVVRIDGLGAVGASSSFAEMCFPVFPYIACVCECKAVKWPGVKASQIIEKLRLDLDDGVAFGDSCLLGPSLFPN